MAAFIATTTSGRCCAMLSSVASPWSPRSTSLGTATPPCRRSQSWPKRWRNERLRAVCKARPVLLKSVWRCLWDERLQVFWIHFYDFLCMFTSRNSWIPAKQLKRQQPSGQIRKKLDNQNLQRQMSGKWWTSIKICRLPFNSHSITPKNTKKCPYFPWPCVGKSCR